MRTNRRASSTALIAVRTSVNATEIRTIVLISSRRSCSSAVAPGGIDEDDPAAERERDREDRDRRDVRQRVAGDPEARPCRPEQVDDRDGEREEDHDGGRGPHVGPAGTRLHEPDLLGKSDRQPGRERNRQEADLEHATS